MNINAITQDFIDLFPGDFSGNLMQRQTPDVLFCIVLPAIFDKPELIDFNEELSKEIGLGELSSPEDQDFLLAQNLSHNIKSFATVYAGRQFGNWAGQLGDGRAILAGEIKFNKKQTELQWKGAGATPYSRSADGRAVLRSSIREYLMSEAMHHLNIATTRALSLAKTGEDVIRDIQYSGNPKPEPGAVVLRTAESFLRFGHFELLSARNQTDLLKDLADYAIERFFPEVKTSEQPQKYIDWFQTICDRTLEMIVHWYRVGFVHGVMNTDNMSVLGLTIDYGPYSMVDGYDLNFTPNTTDLPGKRYAFGKQAQISNWNLAALANAIFPLINDAKVLEEIIQDYGRKFWDAHDAMLANKFGFDRKEATDEALFGNWQQLMQDLELDYTLFFQALEKEMSSLKVEDFEEKSYKKWLPNEKEKLEVFLNQYRVRKTRNTISEQESLKIMAANNPKFILRNYLLFECIEKAEKGDYEMFFKLKDALQNPYELKYPEFNKKRPTKYDHQSGCSMLSCSS